MPIRHYLQGHRFDPETARLLGVAFEMALVTLQHAEGPVAPTRDEVAQKITELRKLESATRSELCDGALKATMLISNHSTLVFLWCGDPKKSPAGAGASGPSIKVDAGSI